MEILHIDPWIIKYDKEATLQAYDQIEIGDPERCGCGHCLNFAAARREIYPEKVKKIFEKLGIDYKKEVEVYHLQRIKPGWYYYGGWFHFVGTIVEVVNNLVPLDVNGEPVDYVPINKDFSWYFRSKRDLAHNAFHDQPLVQINFTCNVPWILNTQEPC